MTALYPHWVAVVVDVRITAAHSPTSTAGTNVSLAHDDE
jgi:hypothetical protein